MAEVYPGVNDDGVLLNGRPYFDESAVDALPNVPVLQPVLKPRVSRSGKSHRRRRNSRVEVTRLGQAFSSLEEMNAHIEMGRGQECVVLESRNIYSGVNGKGKW